MFVLEVFMSQGNRGIGYELVKQLALTGFKVILASRNLNMGYEVTQKLKELDTK
jgi:short-subunit dehydrogenase